MNKPTRDAQRFLKHFCKLYQRVDPSILDWRVTPHVSGLLLELDLERGTLPVLVHPLDRSSSYAQTASLALSIQNEGDVPLPGNAETVLLGFLNVLKKADKGHLQIQAGSLSPGAQPDALPEVDPAKQARARTRLADTLHWYAFLAWKSLTTEDLYPPVSPLGQLVDQQVIHDGWRRTVQQIADGSAPKKLGLYIHIPFCATACTFCFCGKTDEITRSGMSTYMDQLCAEAENLAPIFEGSRFTSVYFGGGTPSLLSPPAMRRMFQTIYRCFDVPKGTQIIYEGNPDSLTDQKIEILANEGRVTRLTIGVQTLDDAVQKKVGRFNKSTHVEDAIVSGRKHGIRHINCDLMAGLPLQSLESFQRDLKFLVSLHPDSVHLNGYRPLPRTRLAQGGTGMTPPRIAIRDEMLTWAEEALSKEGFASHLGQGPRRTSNAANIQEYDLRRQNSSLLGLGFGARAHSFGGHYYIPDAADGFSTALQRELSGTRRWRAIRADETEEQHKYLVSNFRTGFTRAEFRELFKCDPVSVAPEAFQDLADLGMVLISDTEIHSRIQTASEDLLYRTFLYSPALQARSRQVWGPEYDRSRDYNAMLEELVESCG